jgi:hypothetical protein
MNSQLPGPASAASLKMFAASGGGGGGGGGRAAGGAMVDPSVLTDKKASFECVPVSAFRVLFMLWGAGGQSIMYYCASPHVCIACIPLPLVVGAVPSLLFVA